MADRLSDGEVQALFDRANSLGGSVQAARDLYRDWAPVYDATLERFGRYLSPDRIAATLVAHGLGPEARVLDMACGTGLVGAALARRGFRRLTGLDLSQPMLAEAGRKHCYEALILAEVLGFRADKGFDAVVSAGVLTMGHLGREAFETMLACLAPGGVLAVDVEEGTFQAEAIGQVLAGRLREGSLAGFALEEGHFYESPAGEPWHGRFVTVWRGCGVRDRMSIRPRVNGMAG